MTSSSSTYSCPSQLSPPVNHTFVPSIAPHSESHRNDFHIGDNFHLRRSLRASMGVQQTTTTGLCRDYRTERGLLCSTGSEDFLGSDKPRRVPCHWKATSSKEWTSDHNSYLVFSSNAAEPNRSDVHRESDLCQRYQTHPIR
jgi:hypothetical protein